jgi:hypothetical protein
MSHTHISPTEIHTTGVNIRRLGGDDLAAVERLAQLDSRRAPEGPLLGAEIEGRLLAAISLVSGESVADPFSRTAELRALLELRAAQLRRRQNGGRPSPLPSGAPESSPALAGSPPGAVRWLLAHRPRPF